MTKEELLKMLDNDELKIDDCIELVQNLNKKQKEKIYEDYLLGETKVSELAESGKFWHIKFLLGDRADELINHSELSGLTIGWVLADIDSECYKERIIDDVIMIDLYSGDNSILLYDGSDALIRYIANELM